MMEEPLAQFFVWWDGPDGKERAVAEQESVYRIAQRAFAAGQATRPEAPIEPSRDALTAPRRTYSPTGRIHVPGPPVQHSIWRSVLSDVPPVVPGRRPAQPFEQEPYVVDADPLARVSLSGPQQAAMDSLYPLPAPRATPTVWDGEVHAPPTLPMRVVPAELPVRGPVEDVHGQD